MNKNKTYRFGMFFINQLTMSLGYIKRVTIRYPFKPSKIDGFEFSKGTESVPFEGDECL